MIALLQRVTAAQVTVGHEVIGAIGPGLLVLVGVEQHDTEQHGARLLERLLDYRVFADAAGKMNLSVRDVNGGVLLVPQFTLAADTRKGLRPSFTPAAPPPLASHLFDHLVQHAHHLYPTIATGRFGADMQVALTNDGPVTFLLRTDAHT
jgi:D-tyrosyl-tRNA(Tyr) deacylase